MTRLTEVVMDVLRGLLDVGPVTNELIRAYVADEIDRAEYLHLLAQAQECGNIVVLTRRSAKTNKHAALRSPSRAEQYRASWQGVVSRMRGTVQQVLGEDFVDAFDALADSCRW